MKNERQKNGFWRFNHCVPYENHQSFSAYSCVCLEQILPLYVKYVEVKFVFYHYIFSYEEILVFDICVGILTVFYY